MICSTCKFRSRPCEGFAKCFCDGDGRGELISLKLTTGICPKGYFSSPQELSGGPLKRENWPKSFRALCWIRSSHDVGIGDTIFRMLTVLGVEAIKETFGIACDCEAERNRLNQIYRY